MSKQNKISKKLLSIEKGARRQAAKEAGAYDGRFRNKVIQDPKKVADKRACRSRVQNWE